MIGVVISGHGNFASGLLSCATTILGPQKNIIAVDFLFNDSGERLQEKILQAINEMQCDSIAFLTDLAGGTPFNQSVLISRKLACKCKVFSGSNIPLLLEVLLGRNENELEKMTEEILAGNKVIVDVYEKKSKPIEDEFVDGI